MGKALENIRVLDFTRMFAGPFCTMLLGQLGAEIIKIEFQGSGDASRTLPPLTEGGEGYAFVVYNRGKKSITLDLSTAEGQEIARELAKKVDVLVENFAPGVMDRLGLGYEKISEINPKLIYASVSGFGQTGPYSSRPAYDPIAQAMGGLMSITGFPDNPPTLAGLGTADYLGGLYATVSILAALRYRDRTGEGQEIDISLQDSTWATTPSGFLPFYYLEGEVQRVGNAHPTVVPWDTYLAKDGYVFIATITVGQWENFAKLMGREDLIRDPASTTLRERMKHRSEIDAIVSEWTKKRTMAEIVQEMSDAHLPCSPVPTIGMLANDPQLLSREMIVEIEQLISGKLKVTGSVFKLSKTPGDAAFPAPFLGQHNHEVYAEILNYSQERISELMKEGII